MTPGDESATATSPIEAALGAPAADVAPPPAVEPPAAVSSPPTVDAPRIEASAPAAAIEPPRILIPKLEIPHAETAEPGPAPAVVAAGLAARWDAVRTHRYAPLAAAAAIAALLGAGVGSATTAALSTPPAAPVVQTSSVNETRALKETMVRLSSDLATVKASVEAGQKSAATQFNKMADRLDRAEKAQADPAAKLAKIAEAVDRLEHRPVATAMAASSDITNSIPAAVQKPAKPAVIEGWTLVEFSNGRAVVESRAGGLFEVGPGSTLPGVGKIDSIKREDGRVVISTPKGIIVSMVEPRSRSAPPYYAPQRY